MLNYDNVLYYDIALLSLHLLATFVIFNKYMFITIGWIRLPRIILYLLATKVKQEELRKKFVIFEHNFRLITVVAFPICSFLVQLAIIFKMFCNKFESETTRNNCFVSFGGTMTGLIVFHTLIDVFIFMIIRKKHF